MVDFQSRDTRRGVDDEPGDDGEPGEPEDESSEAPPAAGDETADAEQGDAHSDRGYAVVTVTADRTVDDDPPGEAAVEEVRAAGEEVVTREVIRPSYDGIQSRVDSLVDRRDVIAVVTVGGTGVEPTDVTVDAVQPMLDKTLPGFGELVRLQCFDEVGTAVVRTRATAGIVDEVPVFSLPGHAELARKGVRDVVVSEAGTIADLARDDGE